MAYLLAVVVGLAFGVADQCLGSLTHLGFWTTSASLLSAPWLALPFVFGCTETRAGRAAALGLIVTMAALAGYFVMIMGPFEGGHSNFTMAELHGVFRTNIENILGGLFTGPLYGFLGQRWRTRRAWLSAVLVAGALCLEPLAVTLAGRGAQGDARVWVAEVLAGAAAAAYFVLSGVAYRRHMQAGVERPAA